MFMYIITQGEVAITKRTEGGGDEEIARRGGGEYFGERSIKTGEPTMASVSVTSATCSMVRLGRGPFNRLLLAGT